MIRKCVGYALFFTLLLSTVRAAANAAPAGWWSGQISNPAIQGLAGGMSPVASGDRAWWLAPNSHFGYMLATRRFGDPAGSLLAIIGGLSYGALLVALPFGWLARPESRLAVFLVGASCGELAALGALMRLLKGHLDLRDLGWGKPTTWQAMLLGLLVAAAYTAVTALNPMVGANLLRVSGLKALALGAAVVAGVVEEVIFRGYVMTALARMGQSAFVQVVFSAALFAAAHIYGFTTPAAWLASEGFTFVLGLALGVVYLVGRRSLTPVIVGHVMIDALIEPWLLLGLFKGGS